LIKLNRLVLLSMACVFASVASLSGNVARVSAIPSSHTAQPLVTSTGTEINVAQNQAILSGTFVAGEKPSTGKIRVVTENGHRFLEFDSAFSTSDQGSDLHVLLDTTAKPPQMYQNPGSYVNLGKLQNVKGAQRYPIPDAINLSNFKSVVVWYRMANATFGYTSGKSFLYPSQESSTNFIVDAGSLAPNIA